MYTYYTGTVHRSLYKLSDILIRFQPNMNYLHIFSINSLTSNFTKIHLVEGGLVHADRQMDGPTDRET
jgi:hypothetical protein